MALDLIDLVASLGIDDDDRVGSSMGGIVLVDARIAG
jgi:hypothetical protein